MTKSQKLAAITPEQLLTACVEDDLAEAISEQFGDDRDRALAAFAKGLPAAMRDYQHLTFPLTVYRGFKTKPRLDALQKHWSTLKQVAINFAESQGGQVVQAVIQSANVDWAGTLARVIVFDEWGESEVTLIPHSEVRIVSIFSYNHKRSWWLVQKTDQTGWI